MAREIWRQLDDAEIGEDATVEAVADEAVAVLEDGLFDDEGDRCDELDDAGDGAGGVGHGGFAGFLAQLGVDARAERSWCVDGAQREPDAAGKNEIAQRWRGKIFAQIDGHLEIEIALGFCHGGFAGDEEKREHVGGDADACAFCDGFEGASVHLQMEDLTGLCAREHAAELQRWLCGAGQTEAFSGDAEERIFQLGLWRRFENVGNARVGRDLLPAEAQIFADEGGEKTHATEGVAEHVEKFDADAVFIIEHAEGLRAATGDLDRLAGNGALRSCAVAARGGVEIMPEDAFFQRGGVGGEALHGEI